MSNTLQTAREALRRLVVVAAALVLLGHGGVDLAPRLTSAGATAVAAASGTPTTGRPASSRPAAESQPVQRGVTLRAALAAAVVPTGSADPAAGPGPSRLVAPHLLSRPVVRPPTAARAGVPAGTVSGRGPPGAAGT